MRAYGKVSLQASDPSGIMVLRVSPEDHDQFKSFVISYLGKEKTEGKKAELTGSLDFSGVIEEVKPQVLILRTNDLVLDIEKTYSVHSRASQNTLFGVIRFIAWSQIGHKPKTEDMYWITEEIIERYSPQLQHPVTGEKRAIRPGDPRLDTRGMSLMIQGALNELAQQDIPSEVLNAIGPDMRKLWTSWYAWRYDQKENDVLFQDDMDLSWEDYCEKYPVCEFTGFGDTEEDMLVRMHIVSGGSDIADYEESWNWIHAKQSIHQQQHADKGGWNKILKRFPHMRGKVERARSLAMKKGII